MKIVAHFLLIVIASAITIPSFSQTPGIIVKPTGGGTVTKLNPNGDSWSSTSNSGYKSNDIAESEVPFKIIPPTFYEPIGDLSRGPSGGFSDLVKDVDGSGFYTYFDGTNLFFRLRVGGIVSGSKGYSIMIDTDGKFGNSGTDPDPDYLANTSGSNGNPGFEWEIVLETNFRVAVYSVDGTNTPVFVTSYPLSTHQQISSANSFASSNPDYFYDFYVPIDATTGYKNPITATTPLRFVATTVMAPRPAIGGPISDIFGIDSYVDPNVAWADILKYQLPVSPANIQTADLTTGSIRTSSPVIVTPINSGTNVTITGSWNRLDTTKSSTATIDLYKNGVKTTSVNATSGGGWSMPAMKISQNDIFYAVAQGANEEVSPKSNSYKVLSCSSSNTTSNTGLSLSCISNRGMQGNRPANSSVKVYKITATSPPVLYSDDANFTYKVTYGTTTTTDWRYDSVNTQSGSACTGGQADISLGQYAITATLPGYCESAPVMTGGCSLGSSTPAPVVTQTTLYEGNTIVSGTATAGSTVKLYKNSILDTAIILAPGITSYSFTNRSMYKGDVIEVRSQVSGQCESTGILRTVVILTSIPFINTSTSSTLIVGATKISGKSTEPSGTMVTIYENGVSKGTASVQLDGTWSFNYTVLSGKTYYATQQRIGANVSAPTPTYNTQNATTVIPTITGTYKETTSPVVISVPSGFNGKIYLYEDGQKIDSISAATGTTSSMVNIAVNTTATNLLYAGGALTATAQAIGNAENSTSSNEVVVTCALPAVPTISPVSTNIFNGEKVVFKISGAQPNILFTLKDDADKDNLSASAFGSGSDLDITSVPFTINGNIPVSIKATSFSGPGCDSYASATVVVKTSSPTVITSVATSISDNSATIGGIVKSSNGAPVMERGVVYNTTGTPTTADTKVIIGSDVGSFSKDVIGLTSSTNYYVRAYAINSVGTSYGSELTFTTTTPAPFAPATPVVSGNTVSGFTLSWDAIAHATSYELDIATDNSFDAFVPGYKDLTVAGTFKKITGLSSGTTYYFRVRAVNGSGTSANSASGKTSTNPSTNADLDALVVSEGTLSPAFATGTTEYTTSVANNVTSIRVTPVISDSTATITVNGATVEKQNTSNPLELSVGDNTILVEITAQNGITVKVYKINAKRALAISSIPNLVKSSDLGISNFDNITSNTTPVFVGTSDPKATIDLFDGNINIGTGITDTTGKWTITSSALSDGTHTIKSRASLNGLQSNLSSALSVIIDTKAPVVSDVSRQSPDTTTTNQSSVTFRVTFSKEVANINIDNFSLTPSGTVSGSITSVSSETGKIIDVTASDIQGEGSLRLDINENTGITDVAGNLVLNGFTTGEEYIIVSGSTLPVTLTEFKAYQKENKVELSWKAMAEVNVKEYTIERSFSGMSFSTIGVVLAKAATITNIYNWTDTRPTDGINFYRLKIMDKDGSIKYSEIKPVNFNKGGEFLKIAPNPVTNNTLNLDIRNINAGKYELSLFNNRGQKVYSSQIIKDNGRLTKRIQLPRLLSKGVYSLHFTNAQLQLSKEIILQ